MRWRTGMLAALAVVALRAQSPVFEVASVKVNHADDGRQGYPYLRDGKLTAESATFKSMLQVAYGLTALQIVGPGWIEADRFDIAAKSPQGVPDSALMPMLQALLKDRFRLEAHVETREMAVYDLIVTKDGPKFSVFDPADVPPMPPRNGASSMIIGPMTMSGLAGQLTSTVRRPVLDKTGLSARYFCAVAFTPLTTQSNEVATGAGALDIFAAIQQQLGLKLEPNKEPIDVLIVDHVERVPTEN